MFRPGPALLAALLLAGCAAPPPPAPFPRSPELEARGRLAAEVERLRTRLAEEGRPAPEAGPMRLHRLGQGEVAEGSVPVPGREELRVVAACDLACGDLDLELLGAGGEVLDRDDGPDPIPRVLAEASGEGVLRYRLRVAECGRPPCAAAVQVLHTKAEAPPEQGRAEVLERLEAAVVGFEALAGQRGARAEPVGAPRVGELAPGEVREFDLALPGDAPVVVFGLCDADCADLDLRVYAPSGELVAVDAEPDPEPRVLVDVEEAGTFRVEVTMAACSGESCAFGIGAVALQGPGDISYGTCFAVSPDGLLLTALHVVEGEQPLRVRLADGRIARARVVATDPDHDLALLRAEAATPAYLSLAEEGRVRLGERVFTLGFPVVELLGPAPKFTEGVISSVSGNVGEALLQISVPVQPGNSGGPLLDERGRVVGVVVQVASLGAFLDLAGTLPQNVNFAVRASYARRMLPELPPPDPPVDREQAIERARRALCLVIAGEVDDTVFTE